MIVAFGLLDQGSRERRKAVTLLSQVRQRFKYVNA
jgi:hypothetical protein